MMNVTMKYCVIWMLGLAITSPGFGKQEQDSDEVATIPNHVIPKELTYDLGYIQPGSEHLFTIPIHNPLDAWVWIVKITPECPCLQIMETLRELKPFESSELQIKFIAPEKPVTYSKLIHLTTSHPQYEHIPITIRARVGIPLKLEKTMIDLGTMIRGELREILVPIINDGEKTVRLAYGLSDEKSCTTRLTRHAIAGGENGELIIRVETAELEAGDYEAHVSIPTNSKVQRTLQLGVHYRISREYRLLTPSIEIARSSNPDSITAIVVIESFSRSEDSFVKEAEFEDLEGATASIEIIHDGNQVIIRSVLSPDGSAGAISGVLKVRLSGHQNNVSIPIGKYSHKTAKAVTAASPSNGEHGPDSN